MSFCGWRVDEDDWEVDNGKESENVVSRQAVQIGVILKWEIFQNVFG